MYTPAADSENRSCHGTTEVSSGTLTARGSVSRFRLLCMRVLLVAHGVAQVRSWMGVMGRGLKGEPRGAVGPGSKCRPAHQGRTLHVGTASLDGAWVLPDHDGMLWCGQLLRKVRSATDAKCNLLKQVARATAPPGPATICMSGSFPTADEQIGFRPPSTGTVTSSWDRHSCVMLSCVIGPRYRDGIPGQFMGSTD